MTEDMKLFMEQMNAQFERVNVRLDKVDERLDRMDERFDRIEGRLDRLELRSDKMEDAIRKIQLTLENVTNKNIQIIAEGHLDLSRRLSEALEVEDEKEMLLMRVNILENDMRRVKECVNIA